MSAGGEDAVLRLYVRDPGRAAVDVSLLQLVRGLLPVPRVLDAMPDPMADGAPPYVLTERLPGINLQTYLETAGDEGAPEGRGAAWANCSSGSAGCRSSRFGEFTGRDLAIESFGAGGLTAWLDDHVEEMGFSRSPGRRACTPCSTGRRISRTPGWSGSAWCTATSTRRTCWSIRRPPRSPGLIDWEFAHAGSPYSGSGESAAFLHGSGRSAEAVLRVVRRDRAGPRATGCRSGRGRPICGR